jgi:CubicO group peptidase (beta-lactamase class C family)
MLKYILLAFGALVAAITGLPLYLSANASPLHPQPERAPSAIRSEPSPLHAEAVERARRIVRAALAEQNLPGLSLAVGAGGDIVWAEGFGWADIETGAPVTPGTRFTIGTASALLTSAAVGVLLEQGRLKLDEEIQTYVPEFPKKQWPVTLRQLMGDVAGVTTDDRNDGPLSRQRCERPVEALQHFAEAPLLFEPGTQNVPSKYGWILVSAAVESAADRPFLTVMREQIFQPLGMNDTDAESAKHENPEAIGEPAEDPPFLTLFHDVILKPLGIAGPKTKSATDRATFYSPGWGHHPVMRHGLHVMQPRNLSCYAGSMAFFSTPSDLVRFAQALDGGRLLQPATVQSLPTSQSPRHDGELLGHRVMSLMTVREAGIVVAVMANSSYADTSAVARNVAEAFTGR